MHDFEDRYAAGRALAGELRDYRDGDVRIFALPRGGVPVAFEVARSLGAPMDLWFVRRFFLPEHPEIAMGAVASGGTQVINDDVLSVWNIDREAIAAVAAEAAADLHRRELEHRRRRPLPRLGRSRVLLIDDGIATGAAMRAAIASVRQWRPQAVIAAVPVAAKNVCADIAEDADEFICPHCAEEFYGVADVYERYQPVTDREIETCLERTRSGTKVSALSMDTRGEA